MTLGSFLSTTSPEILKLKLQFIFKRKEKKKKKKKKEQTIQNLDVGFQGILGKDGTEVTWFSLWGGDWREKRFWVKKGRKKK